MVGRPRPARSTTRSTRTTPPPTSWTRLWAGARQVGAAAFVPELRHNVYDDHIPLLEAGIPAVDLIDFDYPAWHTTRRLPGPDCDPGSLGQVGRVLLWHVYTLDAGGPWAPPGRRPGPGGGPLARGRNGLHCPGRGPRRPGRAGQSACQSPGGPVGYAAVSGSVPATPIAVLGCFRAPPPTVEVRRAMEVRNEVVGPRRAVGGRAGLRGRGRRVRADAGAGRSCGSSSTAPAG